MDTDGDLDLIQTNRGQQNWIYFNDGRAGFPERKPFGTGMDATVMSAAADLDRDGDLDIVVTQREGQASRVYYNDGKGTFSRSLPLGTGTPESRDVAIGDLNGDGLLESC